MIASPWKRLFASSPKSFPECSLKIFLKYLLSALFDLEKDLLRHSLKTINVCPCQEGCPSCVGPSRETGRQAKQVAQEILRGLLEA